MRYSMARAQFQVLIIPYRIASDGEPEYALRNVPIWMRGSFFPEAGKKMKHPFKQLDARPTKRVVFQPI